MAGKAPKNRVVKKVTTAMKKEGKKLSKAFERGKPQDSSQLNKLSARRSSMVNEAGRPAAEKANAPQ